MKDVCEENMDNTLITEIQSVYSFIELNLLCDSFEKIIASMEQERGY